jgi:hypothetical protein
MAKSKMPERGGGDSLDSSSPHTEKQTTDFCKVHYKWKRLSGAVAAAPLRGKKKPIQQQTHKGVFDLLLFRHQ